jgi:hypothetical protein
MLYVEYVLKIIKKKKIYKNWKWYKFHFRCWIAFVDDGWNLFIVSFLAKSLFLEISICYALRLHALKVG